jgi:hypothetical protein
LLVAVADQVPIGRSIMAKQQKDLRELVHDTLKEHLFRGKENTDRAPKDGQGGAFRRAKGRLPKT